MSDKENLKNLRWTILEMVQRAGEGHIPSSFSVLELLYAVYSTMGTGDVFFLSKGHASAALYAVLAHFGRIPAKALQTYCGYDSDLGGHPHRNPPAVLNSSGSLGHGFPAAAGYALAKKIRREVGRVFCLIGDGETNEGSIWETAMYAEQLGLKNFVCLVDENLSQSRAITSTNLNGKLNSFGWQVIEVDGHNLEEIKSALSYTNSANGPLCLLAHTLKGKGLKALEQDFWSWHHRAPTAEEMKEFHKEIFA